MKKQLIIVISFIAILFSATTAAKAQKPNALPTPQPTPIQLPWEYAVMYQTADNDPTGERLFVFEMELGAKSKSQSLITELKKAGIPTKAVKPHGIVVGYPEAMDNCHVLADATKAANIAMSYFKQNFVLKFNSSVLGPKNEDYYQDPPQGCGGETRSAAHSHPVLRFPFI